MTSPEQFGGMPTGRAPKQVAPAERRPRKARAENLLDRPENAKAVLTGVLTTIDAALAADKKPKHGEAKSIWKKDIGSRIEARTERKKKAVGAALGIVITSGEGHERDYAFREEFKRKRESVEQAFGMHLEAFVESADYIGKDVRADIATAIERDRELFMTAIAVTDIDSSGARADRESIDRFLAECDGIASTGAALRALGTEGSSALAKGEQLNVLLERFAAHIETAERLAGQLFAVFASHAHALSERQREENSTRAAGRASSRTEILLLGSPIDSTRIHRLGAAAEAMGQVGRKLGKLRAQIVNKPAQGRRKAKLAPIRQAKANYDAAVAANAGFETLSKMPNELATEIDERLKTIRADLATRRANKQTLKGKAKTANNKAIERGESAEKLLLELLKRLGKEEQVAEDTSEALAA